MGYLSQVVIDPETRRVVALLVAPHRQGAASRLIPCDLIGQIADAVLLRADRAAPGGAA